MFRLRCVNSPLWRRLLHGGRNVNRDQVLEQLMVCSAEDEVFDVVGKNKAKLTVSHVSRAVGMLWHFQAEKPQILRTIEHVRAHPQFLTLRVLAENKIPLMSDLMLVDTLYSFLRLNVDQHDSLIQQMVSEAWLRIDRFPMTSLSKFAACLSDRHLQCSPLMGHITSIVDQKLASINDIRVLSSLMISMSFLVSPRLRDALISRADHLLDPTDISNYNNPRRVVQFLRNVKCNHQPLLEKCNKILLRSLPVMDAENISMVMGLFELLQFSSLDFRLAAKQRLTELIDLSSDPHSFCKLFATLAPMASEDVRERLESTAFLLADEFSAHQAVAVVEVLEGIQSRNLTLLSKLATVIQRNLHVYKPVEVARVTQSLFLLHYQDPKLFNKLRKILHGFLQHSVIPGEVVMLTRILSMLPCSQLDDGVISRVSSVVAQCNLSNLSTISVVVTKWLRSGPAHLHSTPNKCVQLLQLLNQCGLGRLQKAERLDSMLEDLKYVSVEWFEEILVDEAMAALQRMTDQMNWTNVPELAMFLSKTHHLCPPLMDRIASVLIKDVDKIYPTATYAALLPFSILNYDPAQADEMYDVCVQHVTRHIGSFDPHLLVFLAYSLAVADRFPGELVREIFSVDFLGKLDTQIENLPQTLNMRVRRHLMELNRAVCLECPEFQVPWFQQRYCQQLHKKGHSSVSPAQQQIHKMLSEVLGGMNCVRVAVDTPYSYTVDFECILDKHLQPVPYSEPSELQISDSGKVHWTRSPLDNMADELPPGAQRVAVDFLDSKSFCRNVHHMNGISQMRKRHLEILGYRMVQIPHFEWNSMELSTPDAWKEYLKRKIFKELSS